jgi:hypothetical protein
MHLRTFVCAHSTACLARSTTSVAFRALLSQRVMTECKAGDTFWIFSRGDEAWTRGRVVETLAEGSVTVEYQCKDGRRARKKVHSSALVTLVENDPAPAHLVEEPAAATPASNGDGRGSEGKLPAERDPEFFGIFDSCGFGESCSGRRSDHAQPAGMGRRQPEFRAEAEHGLRRESMDREPRSSRQEAQEREYRRYREDYPEA